MNLGVISQRKAVRFQKKRLALRSETLSAAWRIESVRTSRCEEIQARTSSSPRVSGPLSTLPGWRKSEGWIRTTIRGSGSFPIRAARTAFRTPERLLVAGSHLRGEETSSGPHLPAERERKPCVSRQRSRFRS